MFWSIVSIVAVLGLAWLIRKGIAGTPFKNKCPCTPYIDHLRWRETSDTPPDNAKIQGKMW